MKIIRLYPLLYLLILSSCAIKHHAQMGDIDRVAGKDLIPFEILLSETGVSVEEAASVVDALSGNEKASNLAEYISLFQMGPLTGKPIYNEKYADSLPKLILKKCPNGKVTGLYSIRETNSYPVVSGEIIKLRGFCVK